MFEREPDPIAVRIKICFKVLFVLILVGVVLYLLTDLDPSALKRLMQSKGSKNTSQPSPETQSFPWSSRPDLSSDKIFLNMEVDKTSVEVGEKIQLNYYLFTAYDTRYEGFEKQSELRGFWIHDTEGATKTSVERETVTVEGKRYVKARILERTLSPIYAGDLVIGPGRVKVLIKKNPKDEDKRWPSTLSTDALEIEVVDPNGRSKEEFLDELSTRMGFGLPLNVQGDRALLVLLDASLSMLAEDMEGRNRFEAARIALLKFLATPPNVLVGVKTFVEK